jgi:hypothetical protein
MSEWIKGAVDLRHKVESTRRAPSPTRERTAP